MSDEPNGIDEEIEVWRPDAIFYVNWITPVSSFMELALDMGQKSPRDNEPIFDLRVLMSWEEALILRDMHNNQIMHFEEQVRPIWKGDAPTFLDDFEPDSENGS